MLVVAIFAAHLAITASPAARFDLLCFGTNIYVGANRKRRSAKYRDRFSIDIARGLFTDSDHFSPTKMVEVMGHMIILTRTETSSLYVDRLEGHLVGESNFSGGGKMSLEADCRRVPFTRWDHRAF